MRWTITRTAPAETSGDLLVFPVFQKDDKPLLKSLLELAKGGTHKPAPGSSPMVDLKKVITTGGFSAKAESIFPVFCSRTAAGWLLLAGMGPTGELTLETIRKVAGKVATQAKAMKAARVLVHLPGPQEMLFDDRTFARCWVEGAELALSPTGVLKTGKKKDSYPRNWKFLARESIPKDLQIGVHEGEAYTAGCLLARELVNMPPNYLTPNEFASRARKMARAEGLSCTVLGVPQLKKLGMGGILAVGQGSSNPPRLIVLEHKVSGKGGASSKGKASAKGKVPSIALVGKGVTFDSGGISLKPGAGMDEMKADMGGAAAVLGAAQIVARLGLPVNLQVIIPAAENMPDGGAVKPADVITMANGKTVEVLNTDAEGRLILADALWYAGRRKPDYIIDAATLTGACVVALGSHFAGLMGTGGELIETLRQAGGETFERVWHLPLVKEHKEIMEGTWSDLQNIGGGREGGAMTAAAFLWNFVSEETAWAHLDIAGPAYSNKASAICPKGGTGFGARLLARAVQILVS